MVFIQKYKLHLVLEIIVAFAILFFICNRVEKLAFINTYYNLRTLQNNKLGHKIAYLSDIQNHTYFEKKDELLACLRRAKPDVVIITGGLLSGYDSDSDGLINFAGEASEIAPVYFVSGNYESVKDFYPVVKSILGLTKTYEEHVFETYRNAEVLYLLGLSNSSSGLDSEWFCNFLDKSLKSSDKTCKSICFKESVFFSIYPYTYLDFDFAKRTFAKQIRIPCFSAVVSENKYNDDPSVKKDRGLIIPFLALSRQEINVITLR